MRKIVCLALGVVLAGSTFVSAQTSNSSQEEIRQLRQMIQQLQQRLDQLEQRAKRQEKKQKRMQKKVMAAQRKSALDRINFTGDYRFEAHTIDATVPSHFDGMLLQNLLVNTMFYMGATGMPPASLDDVNNFIAQNYAQYLYFTQNLTFDQLKQAMAQFPPELQQQLFGMLLPATYVQGYDADNDIMYTNRLRLMMDAKIADNITFGGILGMYKVWGDSTGVQVFNGQANTFDIDGNTVGVPNSDILRVERAYFSWHDIGGLPIYLSIGRRPSTGGPPLHYRQGEPRGGTPMGTLIDFQFDGATFGWNVGEHTTIRGCYGVGYESGFGNGQILRQPADRLKDASFFGFNIDAWHSDNMLIQATIARAFDVTDGFNGLIVLPNNPVTGQPVGAPVVMRFSPSANLGDIDIGGILIERRDGPFDWFVNYNWMSSDPNNVTTPFGGLFSDPFETPKKQDADMWYVGARYNFNEDRSAFGLEYNHGSKYWFNFTPAQDDIIAPKTNTRGDVWEAYFLHRIHKKFMLKLDYINYSYDYSGSGWHLGTPKKLDSNPILGFPTYDDASMFTLSIVARF